MSSDEKKTPGAPDASGTRDDPSVERRAERSSPAGTKDPLQEEWSLAFLDDLTGLNNRRLRNHLLEERWSDLTAFHQPLTLIMIDLDFFKEVNDTHGHLVGDQVLKSAAILLKEHFREEDLIIRFGGDEFVALLPGAGQEVAGALAERARETITRFGFEDDTGRPLAEQLSFSMGVGSHPGDGDSGQTLLDAADGRLYEEKRQRHETAALRRRRGHAILLLGAAAVLTIGIAWWPGFFEGPEPSPPDTLAEQATVGEDDQRVADGEREHLAGQIRSLEDKVRQLTSALSGAQATAASDEYETTIRDLQERLQTLHEQAARPATPEAAATPVEEPPSKPRIRASQDQPLAVREPAAQASSATEEAAGEAQAPKGPLVTRPVLIRFPQPKYPGTALRLGREAVVTVRVLVDERGRVLSAENVGRKVGLGFDEAARQAALAALYSPGTRDGVPTQMEGLVVVRFNLER